MSFLVSPGVRVREIDLTNVVPAVSTSIGAIAGAFKKGPVSQIVTITSEQELVSIFGEPVADNNQFETFFTAANFLQYANQLKVVRAETGILNAGESGTGVLVRDTDHYLASFWAESGDGQSTTNDWIAREAGTDGNSIGVSVCANNTAYEQDMSTNNRVNGAASAGATTVTVDDADKAGFKFNVGDLISFFSDAGNTTAIDDFNEYEVTAINSNTLTIRLKDDATGRGLQNAIADDSFIKRRWRYYDLFLEEQENSDGAGPGSSQFAIDNGRAKGDQLFIVVYDIDGKLSGFAGGRMTNPQTGASKTHRLSSVLETHVGSKNPKAKTPEGASLYYPNIVYRNSKFVYWGDHKDTGTDWGTDINNEGDLVLDGTDTSSTNAGDNIDLDGTDTSSTDAGDDILLEEATLEYVIVSEPINYILSGGTDDFDISAGELQKAYNLFSDTESVDINLVLGGRGGGAGDNSSTQDTHVTMLTSLVERRRDCVAFVSPFRSATVGVVTTSTSDYNNKATDNVKKAFDACPSSSYVVFDSCYKYMYDKYNDVFRFVPMNGDTAGLCAFTDQVADAWFSPAGLNRGQVRGAIKLSFNPNNAQRDILYRARVNPIVDFPGQGIVLFGDKTALAKPSAFDRINVRRLFLVLEKAIATAAKFQLFEFNDEFTRAQFRNLVEPFLREVQGRRGIQDFSVKADSTNNTGEVIDRNEFVGDIFVKPNRSINFITLNFIATRTGVAFSEVGG